MKNQKKLRQIIDESIRLEGHLAELYQQFAIWFPDDDHFWLTLAMEEKNHAAMLRSGKESFLDQGIFPTDLLGPFSGMKQVNQRISEFIQQGKLNKPTRTRVFNTAYRLEVSAGEYHFQVFANKPFHSDMEKVFKQLIGYDKDHAQRILQYMKQHDIELWGSERSGG